MPRRLRGDSLTLLRPGSSEPALVLDSGTRIDLGYSDDLPTQRRFQVSPDGRYVALVSMNDGACRVLSRGRDVARIERVYGSDYRFLNGGKSFAAVVNNDIVHLDLKTLEKRVWGHLSGPQWLEASAEGLVVLHDGPTGGRALSLLPWQGEARLLVSDTYIERFMTAKQGTRVVYSNHVEVVSFDLRSPWEKQVLGPVSGSVTNGEMAPDGSKVALIDGAGLLVSEGDGPLTLHSEEPDLHTVWFSQNGSALTWAGPRGAHWEHDGEHHVLPDGDVAIKTVRFVQAGVGLIVARGNEVLLWTPFEDRTDVLATSSGNLAGADLSMAGLVLWELYREPDIGGAAF